MKYFSAVLLMVSAVLFAAQPSYAVSVQEELQVDILILDATMALATTGANGGRSAAREVSPNWQEFPVGHPNADTVFVDNVTTAADRAALAYCFTCDVLKWVSKEYTPWLERHLLGRYASRTNGSTIARNAANRIAQSSHPNTWGPDLLWKVTTEAARGAIRQSASEEEIGRAAAKASWGYVLNISSRIADTVRAQVDARYLADEFDANRVLRLLKKSLDSDDFKQGLPEAQGFYKASVSDLEQKMKDSHILIR